MPSVTIHYAGELVKRSVGEFQTLQEVLTAFCDEKGLDSAAHRFEHHRLGVINLTQPFRLSALETNAQLELVKFAAPATAATAAKSKQMPLKVAVQLGGENSKVPRLHATVTSDQTLWATLQQVEAQNADAKVNLTSAVDSKTGTHLVPWCHVQRRDFTSVQQLCSTTLAKIGLTSGSVLIRCELKASDATLAQVQAAVAAVDEAKKKAAEERDRLRAEKDQEMAERDKQNQLIRSKHLDRKASASATATASATTASAAATTAASPTAATTVGSEPHAKKQKLPDATTSSAAPGGKAWSSDAADADDPHSNSELRTKLNAALIDLHKETAATAAVVLGGDGLSSAERTLATQLLNTATATLATIVRNIAKSKPAEVRYRSLNVNRKPPAPTATTATATTTAAAATTAAAPAATAATGTSLYDRIGQFPSAVRFLRLIGFTDDAATASAAAHERRLVLLFENEDEFKIETATECLEKLSALIVQTPASVFDASAPASTAAAVTASSAATAASPKRSGGAGGAATDAERMADLSPTYDISQVRVALQQLKAEVADDAYLPALYLLRSITTDAASPDPKARVIGADNQFVAKQIAPFSGGVAYLTFLGFVASGGSAAGSAGAKQWSIPQYDKQRVERAAAILKRVITENTVEDSSQPVERKFKVFDPSTVTDSSNLAPAQSAGASSTSIGLTATHYGASSSSSSSSASASSSASGSSAFPAFRREEASDSALIMAAAAAERKKMELLYPTNAFMTKTKLNEMKNAARRRYPYTTLRVQFDDALLQANFAPGEPVGALLGLVRDSLSDGVRNDPFYLRIPPQVKVTAQDSVKTFTELGLVPGCVVYFCWQSGAKPKGALSAAAMKQMQPFVDEGLPQPLNIEQLDAAKAKDEAEAKRIADEKKRTAQRSSGSGSGSTSGTASGGKKPGWLRR